VCCSACCIASHPRSCPRRPIASKKELLMCTCVLPGWYSLGIDRLCWPTHPIPVRQIPDALCGNGRRERRHVQDTVPAGLV
jgi:hypothetical protein